MKKVAMVFVLAVFVPSLVLAWLAVRSLRDQQFVLERQQSLLCQGVADSVAAGIGSRLREQQQEFAVLTENLLTNREPRAQAPAFDTRLRERWPLAEVGFCVTLSGNILCPLPTSRPEALSFRRDNGKFLVNLESAEVYWNPNNTFGLQNDGRNGYNVANQTQSAPQKLTLTPSTESNGDPSVLDRNSSANFNRLNTRKVNPVQQPAPSQYREPPADRKAAAQQQNVLQMDNSSADTQSLSKIIPAEAEFRQLIGDNMDGMVARFLQNKLKVMFWHRLERDPQLVFGAQIDLPKVIDDLRSFVQPDPAMGGEICVALLDDNARPVALSHSGFQANWKRPFVATEIGEALPHWELAVYLLDPDRLTRAAHAAKLTLGLLIAMLVLAIGVGSWLIVSSLSGEIKLARQKTDFVSNVSHELKTPLTSIRMFSELLAEGRVADPAKQRSYLNIITAEAARLTRLINNVLDFSRMERGEKKYNFQECDLTEVVRAAAGTFRPHLEADGFTFTCAIPESPVPVRGDADALSQVIVNLLSNAEKYSNGRKEIGLELRRNDAPLPHAEVRILDRGPGVPRGSEEKVFEKFYRAHDSLGSGIQGSGLGLTIARQIARAHGGDVVFAPREGGGSCFALRLPIKTIETTDGHG